MKSVFALLFLLIGTVIFPQKFQLENKIGRFVNASSFYINSAGFIYVSDINTDEITVLDTLGNLVKNIGGYGWRQSAFDNPADIFADALKVYVADKNNHRIQRFDKNLNFNFQILTRQSEVEQERFGYPLSAVMSNQGDIFILDSENSRIVKFDIFGNFLQNFGGYDYGNYALQKPVQLAVSMQNNIFVIDGNQIIMFDQYGNGSGRITGIDEFTSIRIVFEWLTVTSQDKIYIANLRSPEMSLKEILLEGIEDNLEIVSALIFNNKLFVLSKKEILIFNRL
ncbi:MAG TPA: NHL repeat-containing protein [Ignavibacteriaceae bacterium]|nr:NHL repeat-containing protein [Ignavibacteriaceae bacterium]